MNNDGFLNSILSFISNNGGIGIIIGAIITWLMPLVRDCIIIKYRSYKDEGLENHKQREQAKSDLLKTHIENENRTLDECNNFLGILLQ